MGVKERQAHTPLPRFQNPEPRRQLNFVHSSLITLVLFSPSEDPLSGLNWILDLLMRLLDTGVVAPSLARVPLLY